MKIVSCRRPEKKICDHDKQQSVDHQFNGRMKGTEDDVECEPNHQKPARPIETTKHKRTGNDREKPDDLNKHELKRMLLKLRHALRQRQQATEKRHDANG